MIGRSVRTLIQARRLAGEIRGSIITLVRRALTFEKVAVRKAIRASLRMVFLSVGFILLVTGLSHVRTEPTVEEESVSSPILLNNLGFCLSRAREARTRLSRMMNLHFGSLWMDPVLNRCRFCLLRCLFHQQRLRWIPHRYRP